MPDKTKSNTKATDAALLRGNTIRLVHAHFAYCALLAVQIMVYDAWKLINPDFVLRRWIIAALLLVTTTIVWLIAQLKTRSPNVYAGLIYVLIVADIAVASFSVYTQRGMASRAVMLYAVPIIVSAVLARRTALFATALLSIAAYTTTAIMYFVLNFNEGYKIELYGEISFYSAVFLLLASLLWIVVRTRQKR